MSEEQQVKRNRLLFEMDPDSAELAKMSRNVETQSAMLAFVYESLFRGLSLDQAEAALRGVVGCFDARIESLKRGNVADTSILLLNGYAGEYAQSILTRLKAAEERLQAAWKLLDTKKAEERLQAAKKLHETKKTEAPVATQQQLHTWHVSVTNDVWHAGMTNHGIVGGENVMACEPENEPEVVVTEDVTEKTNLPSGDQLQRQTTQLLLFSEQATTAAKTLMDRMQSVLAEQGLDAKTFSAVLSSDATPDSVVIQLIVPKLSDEAIKAASQVTKQEVIAACAAPIMLNKIAGDLLSNLPMDPEIHWASPQSALPVADQKTFLIQMLLRQFSLDECGDPRVEDFLDKMTQQEVHGKKAEELYATILGYAPSEVIFTLCRSFENGKAGSAVYEALQLYAQAYLHTFICKHNLLPLPPEPGSEDGMLLLLAGVVPLYEDDLLEGRQQLLLDTICTRLAHNAFNLTPEKHKELYFRASEHFGGIDWIVAMRKAYLAECVHCRLSGQEMPGGLASEADAGKLNLFLSDFIEDNL